MNNTTHNNTTIAELNLKSKKAPSKKKKVEDAVEEISPPAKGNAKKGQFASGSDKDFQSDDKFNRTGSADTSKKKTKKKNNNPVVSSSDGINKDSNS